MVLSSRGGGGCGSATVVGHISSNLATLYYIGEDAVVYTENYPNGDFQIKKNSIFVLSGYTPLAYEQSGGVERIGYTGSPSAQTAWYVASDDFEISAND